MGNRHEYPCIQPCICSLGRVPAVGAHVMALRPYSSSRRVRNKRGGWCWGGGQRGNNKRLSRLHKGRQRVNRRGYHWSYTRVRYSNRGNYAACTGTLPSRPITQTQNTTLLTPLKVLSARPPVPLVLLVAGTSVVARSRNRARTGQ